MKKYNIEAIGRQKYLFFTGKGGVGKTSIACATAITLADAGQRVLLVSTDPASNLQDVFGMEISQHGTTTSEVPGLTVVNLDPVRAAAEYKEQVVAPYRGLLPESAIHNMEEQLSGSCTVEIAAFNQFADYLAKEDIATSYDRIIFDTAPTGHTLRMLQLPSAWSSFIKTSKHGASCLGQLSGLDSRKQVYQRAMMTLANGDTTRLVLVSRPSIASQKEAARTSGEMKALGVGNQLLVINGLLEDASGQDATSATMVRRQQQALSEANDLFTALLHYFVPLRSYNISSVGNLRRMLKEDEIPAGKEGAASVSVKTFTFDQLTDRLHSERKRVIFTMGKGGVGKTTVATDIALALSQRGERVLLTTTDPANHLDYSLAGRQSLEMQRIDEQAELQKYKEEVLGKAREAGVTDLSYIEEDLRSPCTQEIAVFRAFANIVAQAGEKTVVIDTAPTGHALLLLDTTESYDRQIAHAEGSVPQSVRDLLPRLRDEQQTEVIIVTLPEMTPVYEASRLRQDLQRAGIHQQWWVVNQCLSPASVSSPVLKARAAEEQRWIEKVDELSEGHTVTIGWK